MAGLHPRTGPVVSSSRLAPLPFHHMTAEVAAFPVASEAAFQQAIFKLDAIGDDVPLRQRRRLSRGLRDGATRDLWRSAERHCLRAFPAVSVDELVALRDGLWFTDGRGEARREGIRIAAYLGSLARRLLMAEGPLDGEDRGPRRSGEDAGAGAQTGARDEWRWMSRALPPDMLLAAAPRPCLHGPSELLPFLERCLSDQGFAECHLHLGAAMDFSLLWLALLHELRRSGLSARAFASPGAGFDEGREMGPWLLRAALARWLLAAFLHEKGGDRYETFFHGRLRNRIQPRIGIGDWTALMSAMDELSRGTPNRPTSAFPVLRHVYSTMVHGPDLRRAATVDEAHQQDPIARLFPPSGPATTEMSFTRAGLTYLERVPQDGVFESAFVQYLRVRTLFYRHVTIRPMTPGLQWFVRFYARLKPARASVSTGLRIQAAATASGRGRGLRSLEVRDDPDGGRSRLYRLLRDAHSAARTLSRDPDPVKESCVVLHFTRDRGGGWNEGSPWAGQRHTSADPREEHNRGYRHAGVYRSKWRQAVDLARLIARRPLALEVIRGVDLCTDELGVPNWVLAPLLRFVREASVRSSEAWEAAYRRTIPPLRATVHVGEEFVHLLGGLRRVGEAIRWFALKEGDRLGHAVALGVDPRDWVERTGQILMSREERLLDLAWEWSFRARHQLADAGGRVTWIEREVAILSRAMFGRPSTPAELEQMVEDAATESCLAAAGFPGTRPPPIGLDGSTRLGRLLAWLTDPRVFDRGSRTERVDVSHEAESLVVVQDALRRTVARSGLAIEVNPTSNLLIGNLADLGRHPLWRLCSPLSDGPRPRLPVCVGSDDPVVFGTHLVKEYQLLYDTLVSADVPSQEALRWIDATRRTGLEFRFSLEPKHRTMSPDSPRTLAAFKVALPSLPPR